MLGVDQETILGKEAGKEHPVPLFVGTLDDEPLNLLLATRLARVTELPGVGAQLDAQLKERRRNFGRRIEAVERIQSAAGGLDERLAEIAAQEAALKELGERLQELTSLLTSRDPQGGGGHPELRAA